MAELIHKTLKTQPEGETHWSTRSMADEVGVSHMTVCRVWQTFGLKPHRSDTFKLSNDPFFVEKVRDIVGLYLNPPENALVLCVDEKSQCQALERSQPIPPLGFGYAEGYTHDYLRHGTLTLFAALDVATGGVLAQSKKRHRHQELLQLKFHRNCVLFNHPTICKSASTKDFRGSFCFLLQTALKSSLNAVLAMICLKSEKAKLLRPLTLCRRAGVFSSRVP